MDDLNQGMNESGDGRIDSSVFHRQLHDNSAAFPQ
jgi:hypothetical protein